MKDEVITELNALTGFFEERSDVPAEVTLNALALFAGAVLTQDERPHGWNVKSFCKSVRRHAKMMQSCQQSIS